MACKYKYNNKWYSEEQVKKLIESEITKDDITLELLKNNSFAVEVNTAKENDKLGKQPHPMDGEQSFTVNGDIYTLNSDVEPDGEGGISNFTTAYKNGKEITIEEYLKGKELASDKGINTSYHSNLTVPGGTNYTENAIQTPGIINRSMAHIKEFSKGISNMLGWFRSDEQTKVGTGKVDEIDDDKNQKTVQIFSGGTATNTRRILEIQSDLFQNSRDSKVIVKDLLTNKTISLEEGFYYEDSFYKKENNNYYKDGVKIQANIASIVTSKAKNIKDYENTKENQFLQLLNKKGNWVNFFIQSIVQDSIKKGYEKVLFPTGETAAKVEGHQTIAEEIKELNNRKEKAENYINNPIEDIRSPFDKDFTFNSIEEAKNELNNVNNKIKDLKTQGLEKLKPIEAFYTNRVTNILNKLYDVTEITDEHGNTWN